LSREEFVAALAPQLSAEEEAAQARERAREGQRQLEAEEREREAVLLEEYQRELESKRQEKEDRERLGAVSPSFSSSSEHQSVDPESINSLQREKRLAGLRGSRVNKARLKELFEFIDQDASGFLDEVETKEYFYEVGIIEEDLDWYWNDLLGHADANGDNLVSKREFMSYMNEFERARRERQRERREHKQHIIDSTKKHMASKDLDRRAASKPKTKTGLMQQIGISPVRRSTVATDSDAAGAATSSRLGRASRDAASPSRRGSSTSVRSSILDNDISQTLGRPSTSTWRTSSGADGASLRDRSKADRSAMRTTPSPPPSLRSSSPSGRSAVSLNMGTGSPSRSGSQSASRFGSSGSSRGASTWSLKSRSSR